MVNVDPTATCLLTETASVSGCGADPDSGNDSPTASTYPHVHALPPPPDHPIARQDVLLHEGDIRDADSVRQAAAGCSLVFHTAGPVGVSIIVSLLGTPKDGT